jgi:hypothetical protein
MAETTTRPGFRLRLALHQPGDMADALDARHRGAAELHHDAGHCGRV